MHSFAQTKRTSLKRLPKRGAFDRETIFKILDEGFVCHVGFLSDGGPVVIPTGYGRLANNLFIHGSAASRMLRFLAKSIEVCVTITLIDGLVLARSAFHHSMNYRSVVMFGTASVVEAPSEKLEALRAISEHMIPQRWDDVREPNENELKATLVLRFPLLEVSAKVRSGPPLDDEDDYKMPTWAGEIPLRLVAQNPLADSRLPTTIEVPNYLRNYVRRKQDISDIDIRLAVPADALAISAVLEKAFIEYREHYTAEGFAATVITPEKVILRMAEGPMWVALLRGEIVGTVAAVVNVVALHVRGMGIVPEARGKHIGELLLEELENFALADGQACMTLNTTPFLGRAIRLYENFGFQKSNEAPSNLFGTPLFTMMKSLSLER